MKPRALILSGYGINCEEETSFAFDQAGAQSTIVHVNDLIEKPALLKNADILAFPGGFSFGDDTGSGNALANKFRNHVWNDLLDFLEQEKLVIGICNGFQVLTNLGLLPGIGKKYGERTVALAHNDSARYEDRWVDLYVSPQKCVFTKGSMFTSFARHGETIDLPVAHGEGKFTASETVLSQLEENHQIVLEYWKGDGPAQREFPFNPNGSLRDIAGICDETGRVFGLMPHPERCINFTQRHNWARIQQSVLQREGRFSIRDYESYAYGLEIFKNAVYYFK